MSKRRGVLAAVAAIAVVLLVVLAYATATIIFMPDQSQSAAEEPEEPENPPETPPEDVNESQTLATAFYKNVTKYQPDARVFIEPTGEIAVEYTTEAESAEDVEQEMYGIADEYARTVNATGEPPKTLTIITGGVKATVPRPTVGAYANGTIDKNAYIETIEVGNVNRTDSTD